MKMLTYAFLFSAIAFSVFTVGRILLTFTLYDFVNGYYPALIDLLSGRGLYDNPALDILYPPTTFLLLLPFGYLNPHVGQKVWTLLSYVALVSSVLLLLKSVHKLTALHALVTYSLAMLAFPVKFTLGMGQINHFVLFFICLAFYFSSKKREIPAGISLGLAVALKLFPAILFMYYLRKKNLLTMASAILTLAVLFIITGLVFGWNLYYQFLTDVIPSIPTVGNKVYYNQALSGFLARINLVDGIAIILNGFVFGILLTASYVVTKPDITGKSGSNVIKLAEFSLYIALSLIGLGHALQHHFVLMILPLMAVILLAYKKNLRFLYLSGLSYILISWNIKNPLLLNGNLTLLLSHVLYGTVLVWILLVASLRKKT